MTTGFNLRSRKRRSYLVSPEKKVAGSGMVIRVVRLSGSSEEDRQTFLNASVNCAASLIVTKK